VFSSKSLIFNKSLSSFPRFCIFLPVSSVFSVSSVVKAFTTEHTESTERNTDAKCALSAQETVRFARVFSSKSFVFNRSLSSFPRFCIFLPVFSVFSVCSVVKAFTTEHTENTERKVVRICAATPNLSLRNPLIQCWQTEMERWEKCKLPECLFSCNEINDLWRAPGGARPKVWRNAPHMDFSTCVSPVGRAQTASFATGKSGGCPT